MTSIQIHIDNKTKQAANEEQTVIQASAEARHGQNVTQPMSVKQAIQYLKEL